MNELDKVACQDEAFSECPGRLTRGYLQVQQIVAVDVGLRMQTSMGVQSAQGVHIMCTSWTAVVTLPVLLPE